MLSDIQHLPPALQAELALDAWSRLAVLQHVPWVGRLLAPAILHGFAATIEMGLKEHNRLMLARTMMERHLVGLRTSSRLPGLIDPSSSRIF